MKLLGCSESKITRNKKGEHRANLEITGVVIIHCNQEFLYTLVQNQFFGQLLEDSRNNFIFLITFQSFHLIPFNNQVLK